MTISTFFSEAQDGTIIVQGSPVSSPYANVREGIGVTFTPAPAYTPYYDATQTFSSGNIVFQGFYVFNTSSIPDSDSVDQVDFIQYVTNKGITTDYTIEVRANNWGPTISANSFVKGSALSGDTLLATVNTSAIAASSNHTFIENGTNFRNAISKTANTYFYNSHIHQRENIAPVGFQYYLAAFSETTGTVNDPTLVITHTNSPGVSVNVTGVTTTGAVGSAIVGGPEVLVYFTEFESELASGLVIVSVTGVSATGFIGSATVTIPVSINLTGELLTGYIGNSYTRQRQRPSADYSNANWLNENLATTNLYQSIDEVNIPDDNDYIRNANNSITFSNNVEIKLSDGYAVGSYSNHKLKYRIARSDLELGTPINLTVTLLQNTTAIVTWVESNVSNVITTVERTLTGAQANLITDYTDLFIRFSANNKVA